jgi:hypothetical protein
MKRKTYIAAGILMNLIELGLPLLGNGWGILVGYLVIFSYLFLVVLLYFVYGMAPVSLWFDRYKKIYHADFGVLYTEILTDNKVDYVRILEQRWFYMKKIVQVQYADDIQYLTKRIKLELDNLHNERVAKSMVRKWSKYNEWDGYLDTESKRDDKLNKLGL